MRARLAFLLLLSFLLFSSRHAIAQSKTDSNSLVGIWTLEVVDNVLPDGSRVQLYGPNPRGMLVFDAAGNYSLQILRTGRAKFVANDKAKGTAEENQETVRGTNSHFGTYTVDGVNHTITFHIQYASFPNWEGTEQKRSFVLAGDELTYTVPTPTTGAAAKGEVRWKKLQ